MISHFSKNLTIIISILYLANVKTTLANISWGSYSYKYLSALLQTSDTFIDDPQDASYTLASEGAYGYSSSYNSISGQLVEPVPVNGCPGSPGIGSSASDGPDAVYRVFENFGLVSKFGHFWGFWSEILGRKIDFQKKIGQKIDFPTFFLKNPFLSENFTPKTSKITKSQNRPKIFKRTVQFNRNR